MIRTSLALAVTFVATLSACHLVAFILAGTVPFGHCGTGWPPPLVALVPTFVLELTLSRGLVGVVLGVALAACARMRRRTIEMLAIGVAIPAMVEVVSGWIEGHRILARTGVAGSRVWSLIVGEFAIRSAVAAVAGLATAWWASSLRDRAAQGSSASPLVSRRGWTRIALGAAVVAGLLGCWRGVQLVSAPPAKPRPAAADGGLHFSFEDIAGRSKRAILAEQAITLLGASVALGFVVVRLTRKPSS